MSTSPNIPLSPSLISVWSSFTSAESNLRLLKLSIVDEQVINSMELAALDSFQADFDLFKRDGVVVENVAAYYVYRLNDSRSKDLFFITYVPDTASVRDKMLYAAAKTNLLKNLPTIESRLASSIFATSPNELTYASYERHLKFLSLPAPLTTREVEMNAIKAAEEIERNSEGRREARSILGTTVGMKWATEAEGAVEGMIKGETTIVRLEIDAKKEMIMLSSEQPTTLSFASSTPSYTFYKLADGRIVFIYACPSSSPIRSRLLCSSSCSGVVASAAALGVEVAKKFETSEPEEITPEYVLAELGPPITVPTTASPSTTSTESSTPALSDRDNFIPSGFSRPSRPGRGR